MCDEVGRCDEFLAPGAKPLTTGEGDQHRALRGMSGYRGTAHGAKRTLV
jgi:hypothetical protein